MTKGEKGMLLYLVFGCFGVFLLLWGLMVVVS